MWAAVAPVLNGSHNNYLAFSYGIVIYHIKQSACGELKPLIGLKEYKKDFLTGFRCKINN